MTNGRRKHGKHSAALPETQRVGARETEARTGAMTHRELEEKFATKEELKQSVKFLVERIDQGFQLHSQELRSVETNLTQKIDANEARADEFRSDVHRQFEASATNLTQKIDANEARADEFRSDVHRQFEASATNLNQKIDANEKRADEFRSDMNEQFKSSEARSVDRLNEFKSEVYRQIQTMGKSLESMIEQQSEKNLYKTAFIVLIIGGSLSGLTYGVYQLVKFLTGG